MKNINTKSCVKNIFFRMRFTCKFIENFRFSVLEKNTLVNYSYYFKHCIRSAQNIYFETSSLVFISMSILTFKLYSCTTRMATVMNLLRRGVQRFQVLCRKARWINDSQHMVDTHKLIPLDWMFIILKVYSWVCYKSDCRKYCIEMRLHS